MLVNSCATPVLHAQYPCSVSLSMGTLLSPGGIDLVKCLVRPLLRGQPKAVGSERKGKEVKKGGGGPGGKELWHAI